MAGIGTVAGQIGRHGTAWRAVVPLLLAVAIAAFSALPLRAQEAATLIADRLQLAGDGVIIAEGTVEVFQGGTRLPASRVIYDRTNETLQIEGPNTMVSPDGLVMSAT